MSVPDFSNTLFTSTSVFGNGFIPNISSAVCVVGTMLNDNLLKVDGKIAISDLPKIKKYQIWSYIYYLWHYNRNHISVFENMTNFDGKKGIATTQSFLRGIYDVMDNSTAKSNLLISIFSKERLAVTINNILRDNSDISIPILQKLYKQLLNSGTIPGLQDMKPQIQVTTSPNSKTPIVQIKVDKVQVKTNDNYNVKYNKNNSNSDIKVRFGLNVIPK